MLDLEQDLHGLLPSLIFDGYERSYTMSLNVTLNHLLVGLYQEILDAEERALITDEFKDITINDMHVIEAIGCDGSSTSSQVSKKLGITMGTLTKSIDGLVRKGYVLRERSESDKRVVLLSLIAKGQKAFKHHAKFHQDMVDAVVAQLDKDETDVLERSLGSLQEYFETAK